MTAAPTIARAVSLATTRVEKACELLAQARTVDDAIELRNQAGALEEYVRRRELGGRAHADAWEIIQHCNRRIGQFLREMPTAQGARTELRPAGETKSKAVALRELGIARSTANRLEQLAQLPEPEFRARVELGRQRITKQAEPGAVTAVSAASEHDGDTWGTPPEYAEAARKVMGGIELDPASNERAQEVIRAERWYGKEQNGLSQPWSARSVWLNPPYSMPLIAQFEGRFCDEYRDGHFVEGMTLVNACTETGWFQRALKELVAVCFPEKRIAFLGADGKAIAGNNRPQAVLYAGRKLPAFRKVFGQFGVVLIRSA